MGIAAVIGGIGAAASAAGAVSNLVGGTGSTGGIINNALGTGVSAAAQLQAGSIQQAAAEKALAQQEGTTAAAAGEFNPFTAMNPGITTGIENLLGTGPAGVAGEATALAGTPGYQFALQQGLQATQNGFSAQGLARSGAAVKGAANYAEGLAGTTYQNMVSNFINGGNLGLSGANSTATTLLGGQNTANQLILASGQAGASGLVGAANTVQGGLNNLTGLNSLYPPTAPATSQVSGAYNTPGYQNINPFFGDGQGSVVNPQLTPANAPVYGTNDLNLSLPSLPTG